MIRQRKTSRLRKTKNRARPQLFILVTYDDTEKSLRVVGAGFRSRAIAANETKALKQVLNGVSEESTWDRAPEEEMSVQPPLDQMAGTLTAREVVILRLIARGKTNAEIAKILSISPRTAQTHVNNILNKMKVKNRAQAMLKAVRWGVIQVDLGTSMPKRRTQSTRSKAGVT